MKFLYKSYPAKKKEIVEVEIDGPARVKFMTASEFKRYTNARTHTYYGGRFNDTPVRFVVPFDSIWHVVVERDASGDPRSARTRLKGPDRDVLSTVAIDAPAHHQAQAWIDEAEVAAVSAGGQSEG
ncbi:MAG: DUF1883 domain-containing protein [Flavobacteriales bacterium]